MSASRLEWGIRDTFLAYLDAVEAVVEADGAERSTDAGIAFPIARIGQRELETTGRFRARAHGGALDLLIAEPAIVRDPDGWAMHWTSHQGRLLGARLLGAGPERLDIGSWDFGDVALTAEGAAQFGGNYAPWTRMAPVRLLTGV